MKKIILVVVIFAVVAVVGMPYIIGTVAQSETEKLVEQINHDNKGVIYTEITKYERGFKSTQSSFKLRFTASGDETEILVNCDGAHGVISYAYECKIDSLGQYKVFIDTYLQGTDPLSFVGNVSAFGSFEQQINIDAIESIEVDGDKVSSEGGFINIESNIELNGYKIEGNIGASEFSSDDAQLKMTSVKMNADVDVADDGLQLGELGLLASNFIYSIDNSTVDVKDFQLEIETKASGQSIGFNYGIDAKDLTIQSEKTFPPIKKAVINFSGNGFDRASVAQLTKLLQEMSEEENITPEQQALFMPAVEGLMKKGLGLKLNADIDFDKEQMTSQFDLNLIDDATITDFSAVLFNPESLLDKLTLESNLFLPDVLLDFDNSLATTVENSPVFQREGSGFKNALVLKKNDISLNGEKLSFNELLDSAL